MEKKSGAIWKMYLHIYRPAPAAAQWSLRQVNDTSQPTFHVKAEPNPWGLITATTQLFSIRGILAPSRSSDNVHQQKEIMPPITRTSQNDKKEELKE